MLPRHAGSHPAPRGALVSPPTPSAPARSPRCRAACRRALLLMLNTVRGGSASTLRRASVSALFLPSRRRRALPLTGALQERQGGVRLQMKRLRHAAGTLMCNTLRRFVWWLRVLAACRIELLALDQDRPSDAMRPLIERVRPCFPPQARLRANIRFKFHAMVTMLHSPRAACRPRSRNCRKPSTSLTMPNTGSGVCLRSA
jgi:hypothetical protein